MEVKSLILKNVGQFDDLEVTFSPFHERTKGNVTVFIGNNGAGKTTILKSLATSLSWFVSRVQRERKNGSMIPENVILNGKNSAAIDVVIADSVLKEDGAEECSFSWRIAKSRSGRKPDFVSSFTELTMIADCYREKLSTDSANISLPLIAFYSVERVVIDIPLKIRGKHSFLQLDGYDNALNQGVDFRRFFEWFREREDTENETGISDEMLERMYDVVNRQFIKGNTKEDLWKQLSQLRASSRDRQLMAVRTAISNFMTDFDNLRVRRKPRLHMSIDKDGRTLNVSQLSQGEKSLMALVGDIARRLAMMNPSLNNPLEGEGVILIDEVDMHLHPRWQRSIIGQLTRTFPNCQFILTTHSPLVISDCKDVLLYSLNNGELDELPSQYGQDVNSVLLGIMDTDVMNSEINEGINSVLKSMQNGDLGRAEAKIVHLEKEMGPNNIEILKLKTFLKKELIRKREENK